MSDRSQEFLSREREVELVSIAQGTDREASSAAIGEIVTVNAPMLKWLAKRLRPLAPTLPFEDRESAAKLGMVRAILRHDLSRGTRLSTTAWYWAKRQIVEEFAKDWRWFCEPVNCISRNGRGDPVYREHVRKHRSAPRAGGHAIANRQALEEDAGRRLDASDAARSVESRLSLLPDREAAIVRARYGLGGATPRTLEEIGGDLGLSKERIRQIEACAIRSMRFPGDEKPAREPKPFPLCLRCGAVVKRRDRKHCSLACAAAMIPRRPAAHCLRCGETLDRRQKKFCSVPCVRESMAEARKRNTAERHNPIDGVPS